MSKTIYQIAGFIAHAEIDNFENGCTMEKGKTLFEPEFILGAESIEELIHLLCIEFCAEPKDVLLDSCDEDGRLDIQVTQKEAFSCQKVSDKNMEKFKAGEIDLWLTSYSFTIEISTTGTSLKTLVKDASYYASN